MTFLNINNENMINLIVAIPKKNVTQTKYIDVRGGLL